MPTKPNKSKPRTRLTLEQVSREYVKGKRQMIGFYKTKSGKIVVKIIKQ